MKKMIMVVAVIAFACAAQAASFMWKLQTKSDYGNMDLYVLTGTTAASVLALCESSDSAKWAEAFAGVTAKKTAAPGSRAVTEGTTVGVSDGANLVFVLVDGSVAEGSKYYVVNDYAIPTGSTFEPPATGSAKTIAVSLAGSGTFTAIPEPTPEPTSALLMVLGMAGLALRRRRA